jgi:hypothetical protein
MAGMKPIAKPKGSKKLKDWDAKWDAGWAGTTLLPYKHNLSEKCKIFYADAFSFWLINHVIFLLSFIRVEMSNQPVWCNWSMKSWLKSTILSCDVLSEEYPVYTCCLMIDELYKFTFDQPFLLFTEPLFSYSH